MGGVGLPDTLQLHAWKTHGTFLQPLRVHDSHLFLHEGGGRNHKSQQKNIEKLKWKVFCLQWGVGNILYIYFLFFSNIIFARRILSWRLNWWKFLKHLRSHKPNRSAVFLGREISRVPVAELQNSTNWSVRCSTYMIIYMYYIQTRQVYGIYFMNTKFLLCTYTLDDFLLILYFLLVHRTKLLDCNFCRSKFARSQELCKQIRFPNCSNRELTRMRLMTLTLSRRWFQVYFHPKLGKWSNLYLRIFFKWVGWTTN